MKFYKLSCTQKTFASLKANRSVCTIIRHLEHIRPPSPQEYKGNSVWRLLIIFYKDESDQNVMGERVETKKFTMNTSAIFNGLETAEFNAIDPNVRVLATQGLCSNRMISFDNLDKYLSQPPDYVIHQEDQNSVLVTYSSSHRTVLGPWEMLNRHLLIELT